MTAIDHERRSAGSGRPSNFQRPPTAHAAVLVELRRRIGAGILRPGTAIRQDRLAMDLGTSRNPVREALRVLEGEGLVIHEPHRGYSVAALDIATLREIYHLRDLLESDVVRVAMPRVTDDLVEELRFTVGCMRRADPLTDMAAFTEWNRRFHFGLFEAAAMPRLVHHLRLLWDGSEAYRTLYYLHGSNVAQVNDEHLDIMHAIEDRDAETAVRALREHRASAVERLAQHLEPDHRTGAPRKRSRTRCAPPDTI